MKTYDTIIVGGGVMGISTGYHLSKYQKKVLVLEQYGIANNRNASFDLTRLFRYEYGDSEHYTHMAVKASKLWKQIEKESGNKLLFPIEGLIMGSKNDRYIKNTLTALTKHKHPVQAFAGKEFTKKYPQFTAKYGIVDYNTRIVLASYAVKTLLSLFKKNGGQLREDCKVRKIQGTTVTLESGETLSANNIVVVCGGWTKKLLGKNFPIKPIKTRLVYIKPKRDREHLFKPEKFPAFFFTKSLVYGFPIHSIDAVKVSMDLRGTEPEVDPDMYEREVEKQYIDQIMEFLHEYIPDLSTGEVVATKTCMYTTTADDEFIIDKIDNHIFAGVFAGHGFKFAPLIGKIFSELVLDKKLSHDISEFQLKRFTIGQ